jgi:hypothetical protein
MPRFSKPYCPEDYNYADDGSDDLKDYKLCTLDLTNRLIESTVGSDGSKIDYILIDKDGKKIASGKEKNKLKWSSKDKKTEKYELFQKKDKCDNKKEKDCIKQEGISYYYIGDDPKKTEFELFRDDEKKYRIIKPFSFHGKKGKKSRKGRKSIKSRKSRKSRKGRKSRKSRKNC